LFLNPNGGTTSGADNFGFSIPNAISSVGQNAFQAASGAASKAASSFGFHL
jgi:hypothetical protein